jgi:hypothetical protein
LKILADMVAACSKKEWAGLAAFVKRWNCDHLPSKSSKNTATTKAKANVGNFARGSVVKEITHR